MRCRHYNELSVLCPKISLKSQKKEATMTDLSNMRHDFDKNAPLSLQNTPDDPFQFFSDWFEIARHHKTLKEPNAFVLSTSNNVRLRSRSVLLKYFDEQGFVFFTNYGSEKAKDIAQNPQVAMCFPWYALERQILIEGQVEKVSQLESMKYFASRPKESQIGAWVSEQSAVISSRHLLLEKVKQLGEHFRDKSVPLPTFWGGYRIVPTRFEFWQGQPSRLHDRIEFIRTDNEAVWHKQRLSP